MIPSSVRNGFVIFFLVSAQTAPAPASAADWKVVVNPDNSFGFRIVAGDEVVLTAGTVGWGPNWSWVSIGSDKKATGDQLSIAAPIDIGGQKSNIALEVKSGGPRTVVFDYTLKADQQLPITQIVATIGMAPEHHAKVVLTGVNRPDRTTELPMKIADFGAIKKIALTSRAWKGAVEVTLDPPLAVGGDRDLRIKLAAETLKAGVTRARLTWTFPADASLLAKAEDVKKFAPEVTGPGWFAYEPKWERGPSAIGVEDWLEKPAGKRGGVRMHGDRFELEDGTPIQFWGTNLSYAMSAPSREDAEFTAARFAKFGVNAVRMHKFTGPGWEGIGREDTAVQMTPEGLDRLDYFSSQLTQRGIYYGWSHTYHFKVRPQDRPRIAGFDELMKKGGDTYAVINWAEDVQDLLIETVVNLLKHKNAYTGKTYALDPALCFIELHNEDDIFFYTSDPAYNEYPTYRQVLQVRFAEWLKARYGSQAKLAAAWGGALRPGEELFEGRIPLQMNPWHSSEAHLPQTSGGERQRLLDNAAFLHETQNKFYSRFVEAIRATGYAGPLVGSPWQAPGMLPHYYNLRSDDLVGYIDRHNYFGGSFRDSMLKSPGGGYFSSGLQQVAGKPFGVSEWIHVYPSLYSAEGPVIMAAYGMGLQGWGASYEFQSTSAKLDSAGSIVGNLPWGVWNADVPSQIGQYPILSRMILRGDVKTAPAIAVRRVSPQDLAKGEFNFSDTIQQNSDVKTFTGSIPAETLAAGRAVVEFVEKSQPSTIPDMARYTKGTVITSATGQLAWDTSGGGLITINTPGTQGFVGFANSKRLALGNLAIESESPYAAILVTAAEPKTQLADGRRVLISVLGRNANKGFRILTLDNQTIVNNGKPPIMLEPVNAEITFTGRKIGQVNILDHDGRISGRTLSFAKDRVAIDTGRDRALYYEVVFADSFDPK